MEIMKSIVYYAKTLENEGDYHKHAQEAEHRQNLENIMKILNKNYLKCMDNQLLILLIQ